jgi:hypothetical protein
MGFDSRTSAKTYRPEDGDTLKTIAERETAEGNQLTWQELALFNWGTDDEEEIEEFLRDELGAHKRDESNKFVISPDDEGPGRLRIPLRFEKEGLVLDHIHEVRVRKLSSPPQFLECCAIPGATFEFDKSFIRPSVVDHIGDVEALLAKHPEAKIMVFGHTDKVGGELYNKRLSERRAESAFAFIINDTDIWERLHKQEDWGIIVIQQILKDFGGEFDPGPVDGVDGPQTRQAVKNYQEANGLGVDGIAGPRTRKVMFLEYMTGKHDVEVTADQFMNPKHMGCGEFNPAEETEERHEPNRRVTFFFFHADRLPNLPCRHGNLAPCRKQMDPPSPRHKLTFKCSFYDSLSRKCTCEQPPFVRTQSEIVLIDELGQTLKNVAVKVIPEGGTEITTDTDDDGRVHLSFAPGTKCQVEIENIHELEIGDPLKTPSGQHFGAGKDGP